MVNIIWIVKGLLKSKAVKTRWNVRKKKYYYDTCIKIWITAASGTAITEY